MAAILEQEDAIPMHERGPLHEQEDAMPMHERGPLHGFRVIDFGQYIAGPLMARLLADHGADVIHVDPPGGPMWKSPANKTLNRGKTCVTIDLKTTEGLARAKALIASADVVVENFRPGVLAKFSGLGPDEASKANPRLVYVSLPGFASTDTKRKDLQAWEAVIMSSAGVYSDMGLNRQLMGVKTSYSPLTQASSYGAVLGAMSAALCLFSREVTGVGDVIEVPLASALLDGLVYNAIKIESVPERYKCLREKEIARRKNEGIPLDCEYDDLDHFLDPFYATYRCKNGRPFYLVAPCHWKHQQRTLQLLGLWDNLVADGLPIDRSNVHKEWDSSIKCTLGTYPISDTHWMERLKKEMKLAFLTRSATEWAKLFGSLRVPGNATLTTREWLHSKHAQSSGLIERVHDKEYGSMLVPGKFVWQDRATVPTTALQRKKNRAMAMKPPVDNCTAQSKKTTTKAIDSKFWLAGVKVLDLCNVIAGPMIGGMMARFGADVVKCDMKNPSYCASITTLLGMPANRGKKSVLVDMTTADGREVLHKLVKWADVVTVNMTRAQLHELQLDERNLKQINPAIILAHFDAYSGPQWGQWSDYVAYDDVLQAVLGIMERFGGSLATPEEHAHIGTIDVVAGYSGALSVAMALLKRRRTGQSDVARASLAAAGNCLMASLMYDYNGRIFDEPRGKALGEHALYRWYESSDGKSFFIAAGIGEQHRAKALEALSKSSLLHFFPGIAALSNNETEKLLEKVFRMIPAEEAVVELQRIGIAVVQQTTMANVRLANTIATDSATGEKDNKTVAFAAGSFQFEHVAKHPIGSGVTMCAPSSVRPLNAKVRHLGPAPKYGQHTSEVLSTRLGMSAAAIQRLHEIGAVASSWSESYIPGGDPWAAQAQADKLQDYFNSSPSARRRRNRQSFKSGDGLHCRSRRESLEGVNGLLCGDLADIALASSKGVDSVGDGGQGTHSSADLSVVLRLPSPGPPTKQATLSK